MRGKFAPVIEMRVEKPAEHDGGAGAGHGVEAFRPTRARAGARLTARSRAARVLPSNPRAFRILIFGSGVSMLGTRISTLAFPMLVLGIKNSPLMAGLVAFAAIVPGVLLYMPAGVIVDRRDPRRVMLVSEISRGAVAILVVIALMIFGRNISIVFLMLAMFAEEVLEIFSTLADRRYLNRLMERDEISKISSQHASAEARTHAAVLAGRPIGPLLFEFSSFLPFLADGISFVVSVVSLLFIKPTGKPQEAEWPTFKQLTSGIGHGVGEVKNDRRIWLTSWLMAMTSMVSQALILIFLVEAHSRKFSALAIGIVLGASGVGGAVGSFWSKNILQSVRIRRCWLPIQMAAWFVVFFFLATTRRDITFLSAVAMFVMSVTGAIGNVECRTYMTEKVADDMIGKVSGISYAMTIGACALGPVIGGYTVQYHSTKDAVFVLFIIVTSMALVSLLVFKESPRRIPDEPESGLSSAERVPVGRRESPGPVSAPIVPLGRNDAGVEVGRLNAAILSAASPSKHKLVDYSRPLTGSHLAAETTVLNVNWRQPHDIVRSRGPDFRRVRRIPEGLESIVLAGLDSFTRGAARESSWNVVRTASHSVLSMTLNNCVNALASRATPPWND
jgi:MFS family permease